MHERWFYDVDKASRKALDDLSDMYNYLRIWRIEKTVFIDSFMTPTEFYHRDIFFQVTKSAKFHIIKVVHPCVFI